jgi:hypothetical protein
MSWPSDNLPIKMWIFPGADPEASPGTWPAPVDISADVRPGVTITDGRGSEDADLETGTLQAVLDNGTLNGAVAGRYTLNNPLSPYYPDLRRNTPVMTGMALATDTFARTESTVWGTPSTVNFSGVTWSVVSAAAYSVGSGAGKHSHAAPSDNLLYVATLGEGNAYQTYGTATVSVDTVTTGGDFFITVFARRTDNNNYYLLEARFKPAGVLEAGITRCLDAAFVTVATGAVTGTYSANTQVNMEWLVAGNTLCLRVWRTADAKPAAWTVSYQDSKVVLGSKNGLGFWRKTAVTNPGTIIASVHDYSLSHIEYTGFIDNLIPQWDTTLNNKSASLRATGVLDLVRASDRGNKVVQSPLLRQLASYVSTLYLPLEDESGATRPANQSGAGVGGYFDDITAGVTSDLPGAARVAKFNSAESRIRGYPRQDLSKGTGFSCIWLMKFDALPSTATDLLVIATNTTATADRWVIRFDGASISTRAFRAATMVDIVPASPVLYGLDPLEWFAVEVKLTVSGGTTTWRTAWTQVGQNGYNFDTNTYASSTIPYVTSTDFRGSTESVGLELSHHWVGLNTIPFISQTFVNVWAGYDGELSTARWERMLAEASIQGYAEETTSAKAVGAQEISSTLDVLKSVETAEGGRMYEAGWGLALRPLANRYSRAVTLELGMQDGSLAAPPAPSGDRQGMVNDVTASQPGGSQGVRISDEDHVLLEGRIEQAPSFNVSDFDQLAHHAGWRVFLGTRPGYRWPSIPFNLAKNQDLVATWRGRLPGARLQLTDAPDELAGQEPDVTVEGTTTVWNGRHWTVDANCSPAGPWEVAGFDTIRFDTNGSELDAAVTISATSFPVEVTSGQAWTQVAGDFPLDIVVNGEVITISAIGAPSSGVQTFTVSARAVNGVARAHAAGSAVTLAEPMYFAL